MAYCGILTPIAYASANREARRRLGFSTPLTLAEIEAAVRDGEEIAKQCRRCKLPRRF